MIAVRVPSLRILVLLLSALVLPVPAEPDGGWTFAYRPGCGDCDGAYPIVQAYSANHTDQPIQFLNLNDGGEALQQFRNLSEEANRTTGIRPHVPALFAGEHVVVRSGEIRVFLEETAPNLTAGPTRTPGNATANASALAPLAVATAGLVDGINPCAFAVLALLLGALTIAGTRRRVLMIGAAYIAGVFAIYLAAGFGITAVIGATGLAPAFRLLAGIVALGIGVGLVELPCTGAIYLGVLGLLAGGALAGRGAAAGALQPLLRAAARADRRGRRVRPRAGDGGRVAGRSAPARPGGSRVS